MYEKFEENYTAYKCLLKDVLRAKGSSAKVHHECESETCSPSLFKLPRIQLPNFGGNYAEWQTYYDMFMSMIHENVSLSAVQKLHYLKSTLSGEAESLIRNLPTTELNYEAAWEKLTKRYNNKRYNCNTILKTLFSQKQITQESANAIKHLLDVTSSCLVSLDNLGVPTASWDAFINFYVTSKLDQESHRLWEMQINNINADSLPTWSELSQFLESRFRTLEMIDGGSTMRHTPSQQKIITKPKVYHTAMHETKTDRGTVSQAASKQCPLCGSSHLLFNCTQFGKQTQKERNDFVQSKRLCYNCLAPTHSVNQCRQSTSCRRCGRRHHSLLHFDKEKNQGTAINLESKHTLLGEPTSSTKLTSEIDEIDIMANFANKKEIGNVLLATAVVQSSSRTGQNYFLRALIDQGSQASFITEEIVQLLGLKRKAISGCVSGLGKGQLQLKHMVSLQVESRNNPQYSINVTAFVLKSLTSRIPSNQVQSPDWLEIEKLPLADAGYTSPGKIDILLGAEVYAEILLSDVIKYPQGYLIAQNTIFGWVISGKVSRSASAGEKMLSLHVQVREDNVLKKFWELENEPNIIRKKLTRTEEKCEEFYDLTTTRNKEGRFVVKLPFTNENPECQHGRSKDIAQKRFYLLERKFKKNPKFQEEYARVMQEYIDLNHMTRITNEVPYELIDHPKAVYIPHHAVVREEKETSKLRVVYDASCKGVNGVSLNDNLLVGPKLQQDLRHILMRWRKHPICVVADIVKMYRQVRVHNEDTRFQRVLWRDNLNEPVGHYELQTVTFGTACAPYLAVKSLQRLAEEEQNKFPIAAKITKQDFYVDDMMTNCETDNEAIDIYKQMNQLLNSGGFQLQKWNSNSDKFMNFINQKSKSDEKTLDIKSDNTVKVLGIRWNRNTDNFEYTVNLPELSLPITKRKVLSDIAKQYDSMGWIAPVIVTAKIFMQKLWRSGLSWDNELTGDLLNEWSKYREDLVNLKKIMVPRWLRYTKDSQTELHAFADASQSAYGAVVYLRVVDAQGQVHVYLIISKTKVAPIEKELTIPRLELCGAVLAAKLLFEVSQIMDIQKENLFAWSDSTVVLAWLRGLPSRWTTFVSNRVSEILNILECDQFRHVATKDNPADYASRGMQPSKLKDQSLWWHGPHWLHHDVIPSSKNEFITHEEEKLSKVKEIKSLCITCLRFSQRKKAPLMGQLPEVQVKPDKPFKATGVDYAGPINIRFSPGRGAKSYKGYICLFVCMITRAIHLEVVSDLTSKGFIAAFRRFIGRRGRCQDVYSDNGTNSVGADKDLREMFDRAKSKLPEEISELLSLEGTTWHYIPPHAPNFGGLWEAGVRSAKLHLRKTIGESTLTFEELATFNPKNDKSILEKVVK
ncbi:hypothetical protein K1T71_015183 [Dendrolimus kikuchii]|nr:hypothetical protein K1T71_015183 [Dendrolimus kikuchii]